MYLIKIYLTLLFFLVVFFFIFPSSVNDDIEIEIHSQNVLENNCTGNFLYSYDNQSFFLENKNSICKKKIIKEEFYFQNTKKYIKNNFLYEKGKKIAEYDIENAYPMYLKDDYVLFVSYDNLTVWLYKDAKLSVQKIFYTLITSVYFENGILVIGLLDGQIIAIDKENQVIYQNQNSNNPILSINIIDNKIYYIQKNEKTDFIFIYSILEKKIVKHIDLNSSTNYNNISFFKSGYLYIERQDGLFVYKNDNFYKKIDIQNIYEYILLEDYIVFITKQDSYENIFILDNNSNKIFSKNVANNEIAKNPIEKNSVILGTQILSLK